MKKPSPIPANAAMKLVSEIHDEYSVLATPSCCTTTVCPTWIHNASEKRNSDDTQIKSTLAGKNNTLNRSTAMADQDSARNRSERSVAWPALHGSVFSPARSRTSTAHNRIRPKP